MEGSQPDAHAERAQVAARLVDIVTGHLDLTPAGLARARAALARTFDEVGPDEWPALMGAFAAAGQDYRSYDCDPAARRLSRTFMDQVVASSSRVLRAGHARDALERKRHGASVVVVANHLSYVDTTATVHLLERAGLDELAEAITAVAGPKVYDDPFRRLAAVGLNTLKVPQSASLSHNDAGLSPREVGRLAVESLRHARDLLRDGRVLVLYPEGGRSRTGRLQPFLAATARYVAEPGTVILPMALSGTERMQAVDAPRIRRAALRLAFGPPIAVDVLRRDGLGRDAVLEAAWVAVAAILPERYQPLPDTAALVG